MKRDTRRQTISIAPALARRLWLAQGALKLVPGPGAALAGRVVERWDVRRDLHATCMRAGYHGSRTRSST